MLGGHLGTTDTIVTHIHDTCSSESYSPIKIPSKKQKQISF